MSQVNASSLRAQIESALADRIPAALTPAARIIRPVAPTGISAVDELLQGGLPLGAITEVAGPECSGRTSLALSFIARTIAKAKVCAWLDVSNSFHPESAAAAGIDLNWLLWVRCGAAKTSNLVSPQSRALASRDRCCIPEDAFKKPTPGSFGGHPRGEVKGLSEAVSVFLRPQHTTPCCGEPQPRLPLQKNYLEAVSAQTHTRPRHISRPPSQTTLPAKPWPRMEQALRVADLLLQAGGFGALVFDMTGIPADHATRIPLATWFRYRAAAERTQASILLLTQHPCARSSAGLLLEMQQSNVANKQATVFTGLEHRIAVRRERFQQEPFESESKKIVSIRKLIQSTREATWESTPSWAAVR